MSHTALYRKIRPRTFKEIVGQPHIVRALRNQLTAGQISHAYLFCGTRGTGKTSAARLFARAVNCFAPIDGEPCNACEMCENILAERSLDVAEIDAASNNGVENIRDLRDEVKYLPNQGQYKVYIVDEVHMLSGAAFNALLKTLEEPPAHVIFILATTDPQKIPATILSRCQRYDFRRISAGDMTAALRGYLQGEGLAFEDVALDYIAYHSDGAMRDALSLLDQCLSVDSEALTLEKVRDLLGAVDRALLFEFTDALAENNSGAVMTIIANAMDNGRDVSQFAADLVRHFRDVLVAGLTDGDEFSADIAGKLKEQAASTSQGELMRYIAAFSEALREMRFAPHMRTAFEVCALKMCMPQGDFAPQSETASTPVNMPSAPLNPKTSTAVAETAAAPVNMPPAPLNPKTSTEPTASSSAPPNFPAHWKKFCQKLPIPVRSMCSRCDVEEVNGMLKIYCGDEASRNFIEGKQGIIREALADYFNLPTPPNLAIEVIEAYNKPVRVAVQEHESSLPETPMEEPIEPILDDDWGNLQQVTMGDDPW